MRDFFRFERRDMILFLVCAVIYTVLFFLWMGDANSPVYVRQFVNDMRSIETSVTPDMWLQFEQAYFDDSIHMPDGGPSPSTPSAGGAITISGDDVFRLPHE